MAAPFNLLIFGQLTQDVLRTTTLAATRIGGVSYAASAAASLGLRVGLLAGVSEAHEETVRNELQRRGIDTQGLCLDPKPPVTYEILGADELLTQRTQRRGPAPWDMTLPKTIPAVYEGAEMALIYPIWMPAALMMARRLRAEGAVLAVDLQHDVESLADAADLLKLCDYVFLNVDSLFSLTEAETFDEALSILRHESGDAVFIVKMGLGGSVICPSHTQATIEVPAFLSDFQLTVGAGDAYDAAFLAAVHQFGAKGPSGLQAAGIYASRVAAAVIESLDYNPSSTLVNKEYLEGRQSVFLTPERAAQIQVYIAGHFHSVPLRLFIDDIARVVKHLGMRPFVPHRDVGVVGTNGLTAHKAYQADVEGVRRSQAVIAVLDGASRGGTFFEMGLAAERGIPIVAVCTDRTLPLSNMVRGACGDIVSDIKNIVNPLMLHLAPYYMPS